TPIRAPLANSHIERQNGSTRRKCLDWILVFGRQHLERVLSEWFDHYNEERPHRALNLKPPIARSDPVTSTGAVECRSRLGGLLRGYHLKPALATA
ncbi:MAG TPA: integrase core domain-containing protein, partial [Chloroflexota bacterium]